MCVHLAEIKEELRGVRMLFDVAVHAIPIIRHASEIGVAEESPGFDCGRYGELLGVDLRSTRWVEAYLLEEGIVCAHALGELDPVATLVGHAVIQ